MRTKMMEAILLSGTRHESAALRQARKDAQLTASADSVRAYLKQIGKVALLNAEQEVSLAKRIEAGLLRRLPHEHDAGGV